MQVQLGAAEAIPQILVTLFGGVLADRLDKRKVLMITSLVISSLLLVLAVLDFTGVVKVWHVIAIAAMIGLTSGIDWPARQALFPSLIDRKYMMIVRRLCGLGIHTTDSGRRRRFHCHAGRDIGSCYAERDPKSEERMTTEGGSCSATKSTASRGKAIFPSGSGR